jgi:chaperonin GroES
MYETPGDLRATASAASQISFRPLGARIIVRPDRPAEKIGRIIIPQSARKKTDTGTVVAMGPGMLCKDGTRWPMPLISIGDRVMYEGRAPFVEVEINGEKLLQMRDDNVLAVVEED